MGDMQPTVDCSTAVKLQTKTCITHIPYRGAGPALQDLIGGQMRCIISWM